MKYVRIDHDSQSRITATSYFRDRTRNPVDVKAPVLTNAVLAAVIIMLLTLYAAMFVGLYHWSHYSPLLPPDNETIAHADTVQ